MLIMMIITYFITFIIADIMLMGKYGIALGSLIALGIGWAVLLVVYVIIRICILIKDFFEGFF